MQSFVFLQRWVQDCVEGVGRESCEVVPGLRVASVCVSNSDAPKLPPTTSTFTRVLTPSLRIKAATMDSPASDLSDYASDDFPEDVKSHGHGRGHGISMERTPDHDLARPSKRLRLNNRAPSSPPRPLTVHPVDADADVSEDTDGSVPASPNHHPGMSQDDDFGQDQVTVCKWEGCEAGDVENMDNLVEHLHDDHIGTRQKKYSCEWSDCTRKGIPHASGYALRAHMRSHTREKPFYCTLPGMSARLHLLQPLC
jgi:hypothetical protein